MSSTNDSRPPAVSETGDPLLLTPGPLTTSKTVKQAMVHDWGSRDAAFIALNAEVLDGLPKIVHGEGDYVTVPMQGSGTFAPEALRSPIITSFLDPESPGWSFEAFYEALKARGFVLYPGKISKARTFRVGTIGDVFPRDFRRLGAAVREIR